MAARILRGLGYTVLEAENGEVALRRTVDSAPQTIALLITDVTMPQMGGKVLADTLWVRWPALPVLFISGSMERSITQQGITNDAQNVLPKPFAASDLARKVRDAIDRSLGEGSA